MMTMRTMMLASLVVGAMSLFAWADAKVPAADVAQANSFGGGFETGGGDPSVGGGPAMGGGRFETGGGDPSVGGGRPAAAGP